MAIIKEMKITVSSVIENLSPSGFPEGEPERTAVSADGFLRISEDEYNITYSEVTEGDRVISDIVISGGKITVKRRGALSSDMIFCEGESHTSLYTVAAYSFDTVITTRKIRCNMTRDGGRVDIFYDMKIGGADKRVRMKIECKGAG